MADKIELAQKVLGLLRGAWPEQLKGYTDNQLWIAFVDMTADCAYTKYITLTTYEGYLKNAAE